MQYSRLIPGRLYCIIFKNVINIPYAFIAEGDICLLLYCYRIRPDKSKQPGAVLCLFNMNKI